MFFDLPYLTGSGNFHRQGACLFAEKSNRFRKSVYSRELLSLVLLQNLVAHPEYTHVFLRKAFLEYQ